MGDIMRVMVRRGGRRVAVFRRRLKYRSPDPARIWPLEPLKPAASALVRRLETDVRRGLSQMPVGGGRRRLRRRVQDAAFWATWAWKKLRWGMYCSEWLLGLALDEMRRFQAWWRDLWLRMLLRSCRRKKWFVDGLRVGCQANARSWGRLLTCACS